MISAPTRWDTDVSPNPPDSGETFPGAPPTRAATSAIAGESELKLVSWDTAPEPPLPAPFPPERIPPGPIVEEVPGRAAWDEAGPDVLRTQPDGLADECLLGLGEAVAIAQRQNPQLGVARAEIAKAEAGKKVAFSAFLPTLGVVDGLTANQISVTGIPPAPLAPFIPLRWESEYNRAELDAQWTLWDFGRRSGEYNQADILVQIARLKYERARQTVAFDATDAYFRVLLAYSTVVTARNNLRRAEEYLRVANNLFEEGEVDRESIYSAELQVSKARQLCVSARTGVNTATARLNMTLGQNTLFPTRVRPIDAEPKTGVDLLACLHTAASYRREIQVVSDWVAKATEATAVAKANFMPKVIANADYTTTAGGLETDIKVGTIDFVWNIYSGGKRVGKLMEERADVARAVSHGRRVCDRIAFEVNYAYQKVEDARQRIELARSAVRLAAERLRIVMNKFAEGEDSPTDVVDAQTAMTVAEQRYVETIYALRSAIARLEYAMGI